MFLQYLQFAVLAFEVLLTHMLQLKEQNKKILSLLEGINVPASIDSNKPIDLPVTIPVNDLESLNHLEDYLMSSSHNSHKLVSIVYEV